MALIGNRSVFHKSPCRHLAGKVASGDRSNWGKHGMMRNAFQVLSAKASVPDGARSPVAWVMAKTAGGLSAHSTADFYVSTTATALMGFPIEGQAEFMVSVADATGGMITSGEGESSFAATITGTMTASIQGVGESSFTIATNVPILGAEASLVGESSFSIAVADAPILPLDDTPQVGAGEASFGVSGEAWMLPLDDTSPLREATATFAFTGALVPYAIGSMIGGTQDTSGMTPITVAQAVWAAVANEFDGTGTMGQKLNAAGTAGDPWTADLSAYASGTAGFALDNVVGMDVEIHPGISLQTALQALLAVAAGKASGGGSGAITFRDVADTKNAVVLHVDATGNRTSTTVS